MPADAWPVPPGWLVVGRIHTKALAFDVDRQPYLVGDSEPEALDPAEVNEALAVAVDSAGTKLWPGGWTHAMPLAFGMNRRTCQPDRIAKNGLPPGVLRALGTAASEYDAEGLGWILSALARYADEFGQRLGVNGDLDDAERTAANAMTILRSVRRKKPFK